MTLLLMVFMEHAIRCVRFVMVIFQGLDHYRVQQVCGKWNFSDDECGLSHK